MKKVIASCAATVLGLAAVATEAAPVQYTFSASYTAEQNADATAVTNRLFNAGAVVSGSFRFDADAAAVLANVPATGDLNGFGQYSIYAGSILQLAGLAGGHAFSADLGSTLVANSTAGNDGIFNLAGNLNGDDVGIGFNGFALDGFTLKSFNLFSVGGSNYLQNQALPSSPALAFGAFNAGIDLIFEDAAHRERTVMFRSNAAVAPVPLPAAGWMFGAALAGLLRTARRTSR